MLTAEIHRSHAAEECIVVRRQWSDWRKATFRLSDLHGFHRSRISGGVNAISPKPFLHAYAKCTDVVAGDLVHSCRHGPTPHEIKVCIVQKDNTKAMYAAALAKAGRVRFKVANDN